MGDVAKAKLFMHGRSQAVRLPKEFQLPGTEVEVYRDGDRVVLKPVPISRPDVEAIFAKMDALGPLEGFMDYDRYEGLLPPKEIDLEFD